MDARDGAPAWQRWSVFACFAVLAALVTFTTTKTLSQLCVLRGSPPSSPSIEARAPLVRPSSIFSPTSHGETLNKRSDELNVLPHDGFIASVARSVRPTVRTRADVSVPQTIWQTARSHHDNPKYGTELFNTWTRQNPGWDHYFMDDAEIEAFIAAHYNETVLEAYRGLPLGVMKADVFRYMILHQYGGVYADMDTECFRPVADWAPHGCEFAVATETGEHFCQWAFAAVPGHGALGRVLELVLQRMISRAYKQYIAEENWEFVHQVTGPAVFTEGILDYLGVPHVAHDDVMLYPLMAVERIRWRDRGVCVLTWTEMQHMLANRYSSQKKELQTGSWFSWTDARDKLMKAATQTGGPAGADEDGEEDH